MANACYECDACHSSLSARGCCYECDCQRICSDCNAKLAVGSSCSERAEVAKWLTRNFRMC
jgi:hypothetical protein